MIDVNVADTIYCTYGQLICQPLDWWSSAAAWGQAVLSVLAIYGAARIAMQQHHRDLAQRVATCHQMLTAVVVVARLEVEAFEAAAEKGYTYVKDGRYMAQLQDALASTPLHEIPDWRLVHPVAGSANRLRTILTILEDASKQAEEQRPPTADMAKHCREEMFGLDGYIATANSVRLEYEMKVASNPFTRDFWVWRSRRKALRQSPAETIGSNN
ncbi:hypothetical protein C1750_14765 [Stenotrophomonas pavanii]|uniref:hypothetical protein n=1 Tax=Stenotrophomonas pavanii TaxID=487698 RepID=UPI000CD1E866|nr:hypothetical protein [Stenotrophomonas pavanii]PNY71508.1 hypothetical protein C1750_14765 [Stenotrophomonas pavanii]